MFQVKPATFSTNFPRATVEEGEIILRFTRTDGDGDALGREYQAELGNVKRYLAWLGESVADFNSKAGSYAEQFISQRRGRLANAAYMAATLGLRSRTPSTQAAPTGRSPKSLTKSIQSPKKWDVFICHATEDKQQVAAPLAANLAQRNVAVWYDDFSLKVGDSLRTSIDNGLINSRYGLVILSKSFFSKHWPIQELNGLASREVSGKKVILPVWHEVTVEDVRGFSPILADKIAANSSDGLDSVVDQIMRVLEED